MKIFYSPDNDGGVGKNTVQEQKPAVADPTKVDPAVPPVDPAKPEVPVFTPEQQSYINTLMGNARNEGRTAAQQALDAQRQKDLDTAARQKAIDDGNLQEQIRLANEETERLRTEADQLRADNLKKDDEAARAKAASAHKLPAGWESRLLGSTPDEYMADAKKVASELSAPGAARLEGGSTLQTNPADIAEISKNSVNGLQQTGRYNRV